ncbi:hypothetical protein, partial [Mycetocola sp.]|uniref:hypothetical protein n=1 Tax=Mycetocola sp. TaxID=1871042 RepID=UPI00260A2B12
PDPVRAGGHPPGGDRRGSLGVPMTDRESPRSRRPLWAGIAAISGGLGAILLTVPFAAAYFHAKEGFDDKPV